MNVKFRHERDVHDVRELECGECSKTFKCYKALNAHNITQHGIVTIKCRLCEDFNLKSVVLFMAHHEQEHPGYQEVECFSCNNQECLMMGDLYMLCSNNRSL